ncbi:MAG: hypothetical protein PHN31_02465 [Candidatus Gracilibacteria bacterium]|nr:hypothetical protein [Candidatus Gracilibacteria bacterium]
MKKIIYVLFFIFAGLIFPYLGILSFSDIDINKLYILFLVLYLFSWVIPLIIFGKDINLKFIIKIIFINIILFYFLILSVSLLFDFFNDNPNKKIDNQSMTYFSHINIILSQEKNIEINNIIEYNIKYKEGIKPYKHCYYLSKIDNGKGYIFAFKYESKENINKNGKDYFIYKSIPDYKITTDEMSKIQETINKDCSE